MSLPAPPSASNRIFIVHGRNEGRKEEVARLLMKLGLVPVILHEQPDGGLTIIEKFEQYADVRFAVVLMTGDDKGGLADSKLSGLHPRARQNVIFELGYFIGKIGRGRICALYESGVELPSDYHGVLFTPFDQGGHWRFKLCQELKNAGVEADLNKLM